VLGGRGGGEIENGERDDILIIDVQGLGGRFSKKLLKERRDALLGFLWFRNGFDEPEGHDRGPLLFLVLAFVGILCHQLHNFWFLH